MIQTRKNSQTRPPIPTELHTRILRWLLMLTLSCGPRDRTEVGNTTLGGAALALSSNVGVDEYRFIGSVQINDREGRVAASVDATEQSPPTHEIPLLPGDYSLAVPDGYRCSYSGMKTGFSGCTFLRATPQPFPVLAGETTSVLVEVAFHFSGQQDVHVLFQGGTAEIRLSPREVDDERCGSNAGCTGAEICASVDGAEPRCLAECTSNEDCPAAAECALAFLTEPSSTAEPRGMTVCLLRVAPEEDVTAPQLVTASITPALIDTMAAAATVHTQLELTDDLSGIAFVQVRFSSASGQFQSCYAYPEAAGLRAATLRCDMVFPRFVADGTWYVALHLFDAVGNFDSVDPDELVAAGLPGSVQILSEPDTTPAQLRVFVLDPTAIDTTAGDTGVQARLELTDDLSGIAFAQVRFFGGPGSGASCYAYPETVGLRSAALGCNADFPRFGASGTWSVQVHLFDAVGNFDSVDSDELVAAGMPGAVEITAAQDTIPPALTALRLSPAAIDTTVQDAVVTAELEVTDDVSGIQFAHVRFSSGSGQFRSCYAYPETTGPLTARLHCDAEFDALGEGGTWSVAVHLFDVAGNFDSVDRDELSAAGLPSTLSVN